MPSRIDILIRVVSTKDEGPFTPIVGGKDCRWLGADTKKDVSLADVLVKIEPKLIEILKGLPDAL